jgi:DNA primase
MSLPDGFLDELRSRLSLSDVAGRKVTWDRRRSNPGRGDWWAPCPFHQEKTASFHVDDRKGFYYCFGCQAKGDLIAFVRGTENLDFMGAVEMLAREAGLEMPAAGRDPRAAERRDRVARLADVMEEAVRAFGRAFRSAAGQGARDYARSRGLSDAMLKRFEIGFAPAERHFLTGPLSAKGLLDDAVAVGLVIVPDDGGEPFDRFRNRLMFPIRDPSGRCIAFGGRAMSPEARAKYLNSPETELFHKGRTLYNHGPAREAAGKTGSLVVAEGYMDVIALVQAGIEHAVAPLGTAVTDEQLGLIWRMADEPVIALDGDRAGLDAAERLIDMALPLLAPGRSLGFCLLPEGQDPDDLIRSGGAPAMAAELASAVPLVEMLWRRESGRAPIDTPERRAALDKRLREALGRIADPGVRNHYAAELRTRRAALFRPAPRPVASPQARVAPGRRKGRPPFAGPSRPAPETLGSDLARRAAARDAARIRESAILLIALRHPEALGPVEAALEAMTCTASETRRIRDALLDALHRDAEVVGAIAELLGADPVAELEKVPQARAHPMARPGRDRDAVSLVLEEAIHRHQTQLSHALELAEARRDLADADDERWTARMRHARHELIAADTDAVLRSNAAEEQAAESPFQRMLDDELWRRRKKP